MFYEELSNEKVQAQKEMEEIQNSLEKMDKPIDSLIPICQEFRQLKDEVERAPQKKKKKIQARLTSIQESHPDIEQSLGKMKMTEKYEKEYLEKKEYLDQLISYVETQVLRLCSLLEERGFLKVIDNKRIDATDNGVICSHIAEVHGPVWVECMIQKWNYFEHFSAKQIVGLLSCTTEVKTMDEHNSSIPHVEDEYLKKCILEMKELYEYYDTEETRRDIRTGIRYEDAFSFAIVEESMKWCDCLDEVQCKEFIEKELIPKGISLGDFTKSILKIATIAKELRGLYELEFCNTQTEWLHKLSQIEEMALKYIATNQSLYV